MPEYDLLIKAGRVFCRATGLNGLGEIAIAGSRIMASGPVVAGSAAETLQFPDGIAVPGLIDLHTHPAPPDWKYGIDPDSQILSRGVTTVLSQGDAGASNWERYKQEIIGVSRTRVRMALSASKHGEEPAGFCFEDMDNLDIDAAVEAINGDPDLIWGVSFNSASAACGKADPRGVMDRALRIAIETGKPLMFGNRWEPYDWPIEEQLRLLRGGDVLTYCFHTGPNNILDNSGKVLGAVWNAKARGVRFDVGHGMMSFDFQVAETAIGAGLTPDTISTDQYKRHSNLIPRHDLPRTMSKLIAAGLPLEEALERATSSPASVLGMQGEIGTLAAGACADVTVLEWDHSAQALTDVSGTPRPGPVLVPVLTVRSGKIVRSFE